MHKNQLRDKWSRSEPVLNGWLAVPSSVSAEAMAHLGWDSLTIDLQHGPVGYTSALPMLQAMSITDVFPMVRVPWLDPAVIMQALDAGAYGVICPMVNSKDQAEALVAACRYPPVGYRSFGPTRAAISAGGDYATHANETIVALAMAETAEAVEGLDGIVQVDGLDGVYVGPADLGLSLGKRPALDSQDPEMLDILARIADVARSHGRVAGVHCGTVTYARNMIGLGYNLVTIGSDLRFITAGGRSIVDHFRAAL